MLSLNRLQLLFAAYGILLCVGASEFFRDLFVTSNFMESYINQFFNPIQWLLAIPAFVIGGLIAKEIDN